MFSKVLLCMGAGVDARIIAQALDFCSRAKAELVLLSIFEEPTKSVASYFSSQQKDLKSIILEHHKGILAEAMAEHKLDPADIVQEVRWGRDFIETIKIVQQGGFDLVIAPSQEASGPPDSTAMHLMRKCPCPVWIHRGHLWKGAVRLLAAVSTADLSEETRKLNLKILDHSLKLNEILGGKLHIMSCWSAYMESVLSSPRFSQKEKDDYLAYEQAQAEEELASLVGALNIPETVKSKAIYGNPAQLISQYAVDQMIDVVVMGSVARTGIPGLLVGNTAEKIVNNLEESILAIKPDGFVSPVKGT
ncbi:MAG: universal stress protein [Proteobacteria bacterium]|nr:universal stress protein [Pseudomonadota bacterium]MBU1610265.1 universal stress protein [Pseudomonadota bacterium]